jgi:hypothetical protein
MYKEFLSALAIVLTFAGFISYIRSILKDEIKPHVFSWVIWGSTTFIVFLAQLKDGGGAGAWPIGVSSLITIYVAGLAYLKKADISITKADWFFLLSTMLSLPLWYLTADPLWTVVILTAVDVFGFAPTLRKAYTHPFDEDRVFFTLFMVRNLIVILALEHYSLTTVLFPAVIAAVCLLLLIMITLRRKILLS